MNSEILTKIKKEYGKELPKTTNINDGFVVFTKWNWDYQDALNFQKIVMSEVLTNKRLKFFICCNHPHCFTMGRGLQKGKSEEIKHLVDFDMANAKNLEHPVYKINRGGGLTFHYPGQFILYPIINLGGGDFSLKTLIYWMLEEVKNILEKKFGIHDLDYNRDLLGLWHQNNKIASVGIGVEKFITHHGLALNMIRDDKLYNSLNVVNPCGLKANIYKAVNEFQIKVPNDNLVELFEHLFIERLKNF